MAKLDFYNHFSRNDAPQIRLVITIDERWAWMEKKCDGKVRFQLVSEVNRAGRGVRCAGEVRVCGPQFF